MYRFLIWLKSLETWPLFCFKFSVEFVPYFLIYIFHNTTYFARHITAARHYLK